MKPEALRKNWNSAWTSDKIMQNMTLASKPVTQQK